MKKLLLTLFALCSLAVSALAAPRVLYASFIPPFSVTGGSIPSLRVALSEAVAEDTQVSLQSDNPFLALPPSVLVKAGQRYGTVVTSALPVDADTTVHAMASLGASSAVGTLTIRAARLMVCYFTSGESLTSNWLPGNRIRFNVVLTGPAGPSGIALTLAADSPLGAVFPTTVRIPAGARYFRYVFVTPQTLPVSGFAQASLADGSNVMCPFTINVNADLPPFGW